MKRRKEGRMVERMEGRKESRRVEGGWKLVSKVGIAVLNADGSHKALWEFFKVGEKVVW
jgi:hypothetical protein